MREGDEKIGSWSQTVSVIAPATDSDSRTKPSAGRERSPATVFRPGAPRNPGRRPFSTRYPAPAILFVNPSPVMKTGPSKCFIRVPIPTSVGPTPVTVAIGSPAVRHSRPENMAVVAAIAPLTHRGKLIIEYVEGIAAPGGLDRRLHGLV